MIFIFNGYAILLGAIAAFAGAMAGIAAESERIGFLTMGLLLVPLDLAWRIRLGRRPGDETVAPALVFPRRGGQFFFVPLWIAGPIVGFLLAAPPVPPQGLIGVRVQGAMGSLYIQEVLPGSPAFAAGVRAGDALLSVNGRSSNNLTREMAADEMRGPPGGEVTLVLQPPADPRGYPSQQRRLTLVRAGPEGTRSVPKVESAPGTQQWQTATAKELESALTGACVGRVEATCTCVKAMVTEVAGRTRSQVEAAVADALERCEAATPELRAGVVATCKGDGYAAPRCDCAADAFLRATPPPQLQELRASGWTSQSALALADAVKGCP